MQNLNHLMFFLCNIVKPFDLICLTEILLHDDKTSIFYSNGYSFTGKLLLTRVGGVGVYARNSDATLVNSVK